MRIVLCSALLRFRSTGFITPAGGGDDVFCHNSCISDGEALAEGSTVTFEMTVDDRSGKNRAANVTGGVARAPRPGEAAPTDPGGKNGSGQQSGTVLRWNAQRGRSAAL